jgi:WD40 repeat protein
MWVMYAVIDGAINCGGGAALMRQLWVLIAQPSLRASLIGVLAWLGVCRDVWQSNTVAALRCAVGGRFGTIVSTAASKWALTRFPVLWASSGICSPAVVSEGPSVAIASMILRGHTAAVNCVSVTGDGLYIVSCGNDDSVRMWDSASGDPTCVMKTDDSVRSVSCHSGDGRRVVSVDEDGAVNLGRIVDCGALE